MRIYKDSQLTENQTLTLQDQPAHHLARVLRAKVGDAITLFNGRGGEYAAVITRIDKKGVEVEVKAYLDREVESPVEIYLAQGIARGEKMDFIIQKAVELGVTKITPLITSRCNVRLETERSEKKHKHWQAIAQSACEQSGRNRVPVVEKPIEILHWLTEAKADLKFVLSPHVNSKLPLKSASGDSIQVLIGPEGGLDDQEVRDAMAHGFFPLALGPRVLRTETATVVALTALQFRYGDLA